MSIHQILQQYWGYSTFRPLQESIVQAVLDGKDTLALLPTGGGKSICYQVPAMAQEGICIVVSPLIALMHDQVENLKRRGIPALAITSAMHRREIDIAFDNAVYGKLKFLYVSPERLQTEIARVRIARMKVNLIAVDEAHCISQWGHDFRPPYRMIAEIRELHPNIPIMALTATATPEVVTDIMEQLEFRKPHVIRSSFARDNLFYIIRKEADKQAAMLDLIRKRQGSGIVYVRSRRRTVEIANILQRFGISSTFYHAGLAPRDRQLRQQQWLDGQVRVMVSTNAFGMGIDKPDVRFVVHTDLPDSPEAYFQEAGRGGRDGKAAGAVLFWNDADAADLKMYLEQSFPTLDQIRSVYQALTNMYAIAPGAGAGQTYVFDIDRLVRTYKLDSTLVYNSLRFLEREGYFALSDAIFQPPRLQFTTTKENLYRFEVANPNYEAFIKLLLRSFPGIFEQYVKFNEAQLAKRANMDVKKLVKQLLELQQMDLLSYLPQNELPLMTFITPRVDAKTLYISPTHLAERKKAAEKRVEAMLQLVTSDTHCREQTLLHWFGETDAKACGRCDICRAAISTTPTHDQLAEKIVRLIEQQPIDPANLHRDLEIDKEELVPIIRLLIEAQKIKYDEAGFLIRA